VALQGFINLVSKVDFVEHFVALPPDSNQWDFD